jgi:hypothetical protein
MDTDSEFRHSFQCVAFHTIHSTHSFPEGLSADREKYPADKKWTIGTSIDHS